MPNWPKPPDETRSGGSPAIPPALTQRPVMAKLTKAQQRAVAQVYRRTPLPLSYLAFRRRVMPMFGGNGAVVLPWSTMFLAIEPDGYTHS